MTTLFPRDSVEELPAFTVSLDGVALNRQLVETSYACGLRFLRSPRFTQCDFLATMGLIC